MFSNFEALAAANLDADLAAAVRNEEIDLDWAIAYQSRGRA